MKNFETIENFLYWKSKNYYEVLGVDCNCSVNDIISSFRNLVKKYHPDITGEEDYSIFTIIVEAYKTLIEKEEREIYNKKIGVTVNSIDSGNSFCNDWNMEINTLHSEKPSPQFSTIYLDKRRVQFAFQMDDLLRKGLLKKPLRRRDLQLKTQRRFDISITVSPYEQSCQIVLPMDLPTRRRCPQCLSDPIMASICTVCDGRGQVTEMKIAYIIIPPYMPSGSILKVNLRKATAGSPAYFRSRALRVRVLVSNEKNIL